MHLALDGPNAAPGHAKGPKPPVGTRFLPAERALLNVGVHLPAPVSAPAEAMKKVRRFFKTPCIAARSGPGLSPENWTKTAV